MKFLLYPALLLLLLSSCKEQQGNKHAGESVTTEDSAVELFPINDLIRGDIRKIKEEGGGLQLVDEKSHQYRFLQPSELDSFCNLLLDPVLEAKAMKGKYSSTSLIDPSTSQLNIIYTATKLSYPIKKIVLYVVPGNANNKVSAVYIEKETKSGDTLLEERVQWKMGQYCSRAINRAWGKDHNELQHYKLIWEPQQFENLPQ